MRKLAVVLVVAVSAIMVAGCATAPKSYHFDPVAVVEADFDAVWSAVVEYFAISSLPIDTIEKDSGLIVTSWMDASRGYGGSENKTICDCGGAGMMITHWARGKFNVFVKEAGGGGVELRVTCTYQQRRELMESFSTVNCPSTGHLEKQVHDYVRAKVGDGAAPSVPTFTPSATS